MLLGDKFLLVANFIASHRYLLLLPYNLNREALQLFYSVDVDISCSSTNNTRDSILLGLTNVLSLVFMNFKGGGGFATENFEKMGKLFGSV